MRKIWFIAGALCLAGCSSNEDSPPDNSVSVARATPTTQTQIVATVAPAVVQATVAPTPSTVIDPVPDVSQSAQNSVSEQQQATELASRKSKVAQLRSEIQLLERQKSTSQERMGQFKSERMAREKADGVGYPQLGAETFAYNEAQSLGNEIAAKQRQIDNLMLSQ